MVKTTQLDFTKVMINNTNGKPVLNITTDLIVELGITRNTNIEEFREQIPDLTFADIIDSLFDSVVFSSNKHYSLYNGVLVDIRHAKTNDTNYIDIDKEDLETLKVILEKTITTPPPKDTQSLNRKIGFIFEVIDNALVDFVMGKITSHDPDEREI